MDQDEETAIDHEMLSRPFHRVLRVLVLVNSNRGRIDWQ